MFESDLNDSRTTFIRNASYLYLDQYNLSKTTAHASALVSDNTRRSWAIFPL